MTFERGDLVWLNFSPHAGHEQTGRRPALVVSPADYNTLSNCILVCPITSNMGMWAWKIRLPAGLPIQGAVLVDQVKSIDAKARQAELVGERLDVGTMAEILARLATLTG